MADVIYLNTIEELEQLFQDTLIRSPGWSSSAQKLDKDIKSAGYDIPMTFFHEYKLPVSAPKLEKETDRLWILGFWDDQIPRMQEALQKQIVLSDNLKQQLLQNRPSIDQKIIEYAQSIQQNNSNLKHIQIPKNLDKLHFIRGTVYGYPPENIDFWIKNYPNDAVLNEALDYKQILKKQFGIDYVLMRLTKEQGEKLVTMLSNEKTKKKQFESATKRTVQTDSTGRFDPTGYLQFMEQRGYGDD